MQTPVTEDLMNEHGLLNRILIIFDNYLILSNSKKSDKVKYIADAIKIIKEFIEDFHEKMEEKYIFPCFNNTKFEDVTKILIQQHIDSRTITSNILELCSLNKIKELDNEIKLFIKMYRTHSAREDTLIFRKLRKFITEEEMIKISKIMDEKEDEIFGEKAYDGILQKIIIIEQEFGLSLTRF